VDVLRAERNFHSSNNDRWESHVKDLMIAIAGITCRIYMEIETDDGTESWGSATAFFVSPTKLLTLDHSRFHIGQRVVACAPGRATVELGNEAKFKSSGGNTFSCAVVDKFYETHGWPGAVAILETFGYSTMPSVPLDVNCSVQAGETVYVMGYPARYNVEHLKLNNPEIDISTQLPRIKQMLPEGTLCVTTGPLISNNGPAKIREYRLSATAGMGGGPVIGRRGSIFGNPHS